MSEFINTPIKAMYLVGISDCLQTFQIELSKHSSTSFASIVFAREQPFGIVIGNIQFQISWHYLVMDIGCRVERVKFKMDRCPEDHFNVNQNNNADHYPFASNYKHRANVGYCSRL